jgi:hypothetical protein
VAQWSPHALKLPAAGHSQLYFLVPLAVRCLRDDDGLRSGAPVVLSEVGVGGELVGLISTPADTESW